MTDHDDEPTLGLRQIDPEGYAEAQRELADRIAASDVPQFAAIAVVDAAIRASLPWANPLDLVYLLRKRADEIEAQAVDAAVVDNPDLLGPMQ